MHGKCYRLLSGCRNAGIPASSGQGEEACWSTTAALADTHLESPTSDALGTGLREEVYVTAVQAGWDESPLRSLS